MTGPLRRTLWAALFTILATLATAAPAARAKDPSADVSATVTPAGPLRPGSAATIVVTVTVHDGLHAQSHTPHDPNFIPLVIKPKPTPVATFGTIEYPPGKDETYPALGTLNVYTDANQFRVPVTIAATAAGSVELAGTVGLQACNDESCFAPERLPFSVKVDVAGAPIAAAEPPATQAGPAVTPPPSTTPQTARADDAPISVPLAFGAAFLAGLLFNVMPCVLPVLPLKAIGFYEVSQHQRGRSFFLGTVFSLGLIGVFAVLAVLVLVLRVIDWGGLFGKWWFAWPLAGVMLAMGLGLLGTWTTTLPTALYRFEPRHDTVTGNVFWGALTALLATPCTAPLLPLVLAFAVAQPAYVGVPAMLMVGVGMASPYLVLSAFPEAARRFPRTGPWPELFKQVMGFLVIAVAVYIAGGRLFAGPEFWWLVAAVVGIASLFLVARTTQLTKNAGPVAISATLAMLMFGGTAAWAQRMTAAGAEKWQPYSDALFRQLRADGRPVMLKFTANWCGSCQYLEGTVYHDPAVWAEMDKQHMAAVRVDLTDDDAPGHDLLRTLNPVGGIPVTAVYPARGDRPTLMTNLYTSAQFIKVVDDVTKP